MNEFVNPEVYLSFEGVTLGCPREACEVTAGAAVAGCLTLPPSPADFFLRLNYDNDYLAALSNR
jgi:hypothetical protein